MLLPVPSGPTSATTLPRVAKAADAIVVGSRFSRAELLDALEVEEAKVRVIPYGVGPPFTSDGQAAEGDYVLAVSTLELDRFEARGDPGGPIGVTGEEDVLSQFTWTESDVVLPFAGRDRDPAI